MATNHVMKQVIKRLSQVHFRPVKSITFAFNPFVGNVESIRQCLFHLNSRKLLITNPKMAMKVDIKSNVCYPTMEVNFNDDTTTLYKTNNLTSLEIIENFLQQVNAKDVAVEPTVLTKKDKKKR